MIDFYIGESIPGLFGAKRPALNKGLLESIKKGEFTRESNLEVASELLTVVWNEYENYGTHGTTLQDADIVLAHKALMAVLTRIDLPFTLPWRDFDSFRSYWLREGASGSYQARRDILDTLFTPIRQELDRREALSDQANLASAISPHATLGWEIVDEKIAALKKSFAQAQTAEDYSDVGNRAISTLEVLANTVYDVEKHVRPGEEPLAYSNTKLRFDRFIEDSLPGTSNSGLRKIARGAVELSQAIKHGSITTRKNAGLLGDSVILLTHMLRRLEEEE